MIPPTNEGITPTPEEIAEYIKLQEKLLGPRAETDPDYLKGLIPALRDVLAHFLVSSTAGMVFEVAKIHDLSPQSKGSLAGEIAQAPTLFSQEQIENLVTAGASENQTFFQLLMVKYLLINLINDVLSEIPDYCQSLEDFVPMNPLRKGEKSDTVHEEFKAELLSRNELLSDHGKSNKKYA